MNRWTSTPGSPTTPGTATAEKTPTPHRPGGNWHPPHTVAPSGDHAIFDRAPTLGGGGGGAAYNQTQLAEAWRTLQQAADELKDADTYRYDLVNVARQVLSNHASVLHQEVLKAWRAKDAPALETASGQFLQLLSELDELLATRREFLLGRWLEDAKRWGTNDAERAKFEWNARRVLTLWGEGPAIDDYARKQWSGMISGYYRPRWERLFQELTQCLQQDKPFDEKAFHAALRPWMAGWSDSRESYPAEPRGDSVAVAAKLWSKYETRVPPQRRQPDDRQADELFRRPAAVPGAPGQRRVEQLDRRVLGDGCHEGLRTPGGKSIWSSRRRSGVWSLSATMATSGSTGSRSRLRWTERLGTWWPIGGTIASPSTSEGYTCRFPPRSVRYIRVRQTHNSANTGRHLVEVMATPQ